MAVGGDFVADPNEKALAEARAEVFASRRRLQAIEDLIGPEPLEPMKRLVQGDKFIRS